MVKLNEINFRIQQTTSQIELHKTNNDHSAVRMEELSKELLHLGEVKKLLIRLKNNKMIEKKDFILKTINTSLADVFIDKKIRIDIEASNTTSSAGKINIKYDIVYYENEIEMGRNETLLISIGGGVMSFISILFKILVGFLYSKNRLYIFDESLAEVSELYRPRMAQFLQKFCEVHNFTIILITQTSDIAEYSDLAYLLDGDYNDEDVMTLKIEKIIGKIPESNYYYSNIENFQSIKKLEFKYAGFTTIIGKNSIGKSASFRALNSIIYNNFDQKKYPRLVGKSKPGKVLNSKITFGYFTKENDPQNEVTKITLSRKNSSLIYTFDGMDFVGKNLAFEKVKEKIENIGFKYLNLKEQYKNFKGTLKDQTERLAITTQQDGYYLIGDKSTDTIKIFDFLFDSRQVTIAIQNLNNDILYKESELNELNLSIMSNKLKIKHDETMLKSLMVDYSIELIELLEHTESNVIIYSKEVEFLEKIIKNIDTTIYLASLIDNYKNLESQIHVCNQKIDYLHPIIMTYSALIEFSANIKLIYEIQEKEKEKEQLSNRISYNSRILETYEKVIYYSESVALLEELFQVSDLTEVWNRRVNKLSSQLNKLDDLLNVLQRGLNLQILLENYKRQNDYMVQTNHAVRYNLKLLDVLNTSIRIEELKALLEKFKFIYDKIFNINEDINNKENDLHNLHHKYNLVPCNQCNCTGFIFNN